jgi:type II secretion system protein G
VTTFFNRLRRHQKGFTLIELLVVVAIIALLATFAVPKLFDAINKSKDAPGKADLNTISSALERYYMDNNQYPTATAHLVTAGTPAGNPGNYLKPTTTFKNGFKVQYLYGTDSGGSGYVLIDLADTPITWSNTNPATATVSITCAGAPAHTATFNLTKDESTKAMSVVSNIPTANLAGCALPANASDNARLMTN